MKGDFTRSTFKPKKHYSSVRMQQGRLQLDADWNEQVDIQTYLLQTHAQDVIGLCGAPEAESDRNLDATANFKIIQTEDGQDLKIGAGQIYVDGILCKLEEETKYTQQANYPNAQKIDLSSGEEGIYIAYLDVWQRHISAIEDPDIREVALNGADTTTRTQTIAQVKLGFLHKDDTKADPQQFIDDKKNKKQAKLTADRVSATSILETHLYRVEIHQGGNTSDNGNNRATFKWSRDNGTVVSEIESIAENIITISQTSYDRWQSSQPDQWLEIIDEERELAGQPGTLVRLVQVFDNKLVCDTRVLDNSGNSLFQPVSAQQARDRKLKVRRWDYTSDTSDPSNIGGIPISIAWIPLGNEGIQVKFESDSFYTTGDYWLIPTRAITREIEWSRDKDNTPLAQPAEGIHHHYCALAKLTYKNRSFKTSDDSDLRKTFPPLTKQGSNSGSIGLEPSQQRAALHVKGEPDQTGGTLHPPTPKPNKPLDVIDLSDSQQLKVGDLIIIEENNEQKTIITGSQNNGLFEVDPPITISGTSPLPFRYQQPIARFADSQGETKIIATADGRVGIGTEGPKFPLEVKGTIAADRLILPPSGSFEVGILKAQELQLQKGQPNQPQVLYSSFKVDDSGTTKQVQFNAEQQNTDFVFRNGNVRLTNSDANTAIALSIGNTTLTHSDNELSIDTNVTVQNPLTATTLTATDQITANGLTIANDSQVGALTIDRSLKFGTGQAVSQISTDGTFRNPNHETLASQLAIKTYLDTQLQPINANLLTRAFVNGSSTVPFHASDLTVGGLTLAQGVRITEFSTRSELRDSDLSVPTEKAIKTYVERQIQAAIDSPQFNLDNFVTRTLTVTGTGITPTAVPSTAGQKASLSVQALPSIPGSITRLESKNISSPTIMQPGGIVTIADQAPRLITTSEESSVTVTPPFDAGLNASILQYQSPIAAFADSNGKNQVTVTANGSVLIGELNETQPLELSTPLLDTKLYVNGRIFGKDIRGDIQQLSSRELKDNITELSSQEASQLLDSLNPIKFVYTDDANQTVRVGFISEEVPDVVSSPDRKAISPLDVVAVLTKALRDQQQMTTALVKVLDQQQRDITKLQEQVRLLEQHSTRKFWSL